MKKKEKNTQNNELVEEIESLKKTLEKYDLYSNSKIQIESISNWFIAIAIGVFIAIFSNLDKIQIDNQIPYKEFLLLSLMFTGIGLMFLTMLKFVLLLKDLIIKDSKGFFNKTIYKITKGNVTKKDFEKTEKSFYRWVNVINKPNALLKLFPQSILLIIIGIFLFIAYMIFFIIVYK